MPKSKQDGPPKTSDWVDQDDAPELTAEFFDDAEYFHGNTFIKRGRSSPPGGYDWEPVNVRLDRDVLAKLREAGPGWQVTVNGLLRTSLGLGDRTPTRGAPPAAPRKRARAAS